MTHSDSFSASELDPDCCTVAALVVTADECGVRTANWFWNRRWRWDDIVGFDYVQAGKHVEATRYYTARVLLSNGNHGWLGALTGSKSGHERKR